MNISKELSLLSNEILKKSNRRTHSIIDTPAILMKKRKKRPKKEGFLNGRWDEKEHLIFLQLFKIFGNDWKGVKNKLIKIERLMKNRTSIQIRSHAQKYLVKLMKKYKVLKVIYCKTKDNKFVPKPSLMRKIEKDDLKFFIEFGLSDEKKIFHIEKDMKCLEKLKSRNVLRPCEESLIMERTQDSLRNVIQPVYSFSILSPPKKFTNFLSEKIKYLISSNERILNDINIYHANDVDVYPELFEYLTQNSFINLDFIGTQFQASSLLILYKQIKELEKDYFNYQ